MDRIAKELFMIARELDDFESEDEYGFTRNEFYNARGNSIFGYVVHNGMTDNDWAYCSESRGRTLTAGEMAKEFIQDESLDSDELVEKLDGIVGNGVVLVGDETSDLKLVDGEYFAEINGEWRLVNVVGYFKARF